MRARAEGGSSGLAKTCIPPSQEPRTPQPQCALCGLHTWALARHLAIYAVDGALHPSSAFDCMLSLMVHAGHSLRLVLGAGLEWMDATLVTAWKVLVIAFWCVGIRVGMRLAQPRPRPAGCCLTSNGVLRGLRSGTAMIPPPANKRRRAFCK